jgi:hypothetical protein
MSTPDNAGDLRSKWWVQLLIAAWILAVVTVYFRLQFLRLLEIAPPGP